MNNTNEAIVSSVISKYAKLTKCSKAKLEAFANELLSSVPNSCSNAGRKASTSILELRSKMKEDALQGSLGDNFTSKYLSGVYKRSVIEVNNTLNYLAKEGVFVKSGKAESCGKGRKQILWSVLASKGVK